MAAPKFDECKILSLPDDEIVDAAQEAIAENPANAPMAMFAKDASLTKQQLAFLTGKYWGNAGKRFTVGFMDSPNVATRNKILLYMNRWNAEAGVNVTFEYSETDPIVRIMRESRDGYYSYLGRDILRIPRDRPTMNLAGFTDRTADAEYERIVVHETGHTLGAPHEHLRRAVIAKLVRAKVLQYFRATAGWDDQTTISNVLTPLEESSILGSAAADEDSVMCYPLPGSITVDGRPIRGGPRLSRADIEFVRSVYAVVGGGGGGGGGAGLLSIDPDAKTVSLPPGWRIL